MSANQKIINLNSDYSSGSTFIPDALFEDMQNRIITPSAAGVFCMILSLHQFGEKITLDKLQKHTPESRKKTQRHINELLKEKYIEKDGVFFNVIKYATVEGL